MALIKVSDFITEVKALIQDEDATRYGEDRYYTALNVAISEGYKLRPDFFRALPWNTMPAYDPGNGNDVLNWPMMYKQALLMYITGWLQLTDAEGNEDARAAAMLQVFASNLRNG